MASRNLLQAIRGTIRGKREAFNNYQHPVLVFRPRAFIDGSGAVEIQLDGGWIALQKITQNGGFYVQIKTKRGRIRTAKEIHDELVAQGVNPSINIGTNPNYYIPCSA